MINMIKADLYRLFRGKMAYIAVAVLLITSGLAIWQRTPGASIFSASVDTQVETTGPDGSVESTSSLDDMNNALDQQKNETDKPQLDRQMLANGVNLYYVFIFLVGVIVVQDFSFKAIKNSLTSAINRRTYYWSKVVTSLIVCLVLAYGYTLFVYGTNVLFNGMNASTPLIDLLAVTLRQIPYFIGLVGLLVGIIFLEQRAASYYGASLVILIVISLTLLTLQLTGIANVVSLLSFEPQTALKIVSGNPDSDYLLRFTLTGLVSFILFTGLGYLRFSRSEIK